MHRHVPVSLLLVSILVLCIGCGGRQHPDGLPLAPAELPRVIAAMGRAEALSMDLKMTVIQPDDALVFTISAWVDTDDDLRLYMTKFATPFLSTTIANQGALRAILIQDDLAIDTDIDALFAAAQAVEAEQGPADAQAPEPVSGQEGSGIDIDLLQELRLLIAEFKAGPIPICPEYSPSERHAGAYRCQMPDGNSADFRLTPELDGVAEKWIYDADGELLSHIRYGRYERMDGLYRATKMRLEIPAVVDSYQIQLRRFDRVPDVAPSRMQIAIPGDVTVLEDRAFIRHLIDGDES